MTSLRVVSLVGLLVLAQSSAAQGTPTAPPTRVPTAADSAILRAIDLPRTMQRAREAGVPDSSLRGVLERMRQRGIPAGDATAGIGMEVEAVERGGDRNNFGAFVRAQVESGLRGRELAAAIRAERERRGMGAGDRGGRPDSAPRREVRGNRPNAGAPVRPRPDSADETPVVSAEVVLALSVADGIRSAPGMADSILQANGITRAGFDSLLYRISADSAQYAAGRK